LVAPPNRPTNERGIPVEIKNGVYKLAGGEIAVWLDGCICIKTRNKHNDPFELADDEAKELADLLRRLADQNPIRLPGNRQHTKGAARNESIMQFCFEGEIDEENLVRKLEELVGFKMDPVGGAEGTAPALYSLQRYDRGFKTYLWLAWNGRPPKTDPIDCAIQLSRFLRTAVITDLPEEHPDHAVPSAWCIIEPSGDVFSVLEDDSVDQTHGLVLDRTSQRPLSPTRKD